MNKTLETLKEYAIKKSLSAGQELFCEGEQAKGFYSVLDGEIKIYKMDLQGREIEVDRLGPNDVLGEVILFAADKYPIYAQAEKKSSVLFFPKEIVMRAVHDQPEIANYFLKILAKKCLSLNKRLEVLSLTTVKERVLHFLTSNCHGQQKCLVTLTMKKKQLAARIGTSSETLSRCLRQLQDEKMISVQNKNIQILDCNKLKKCLEEPKD